jgi:hypothetical protein
MNIIANHLAIVNERPDMSPKPKTPATKDNIKNIIAHVNNDDSILFTPHDFFFYLPNLSP